MLLPWFENRLISIGPKKWLWYWFIFNIELDWYFSCFLYDLHSDYCPNLCCYHNVSAVVPSRLLQVITNLDGVPNWTFLFSLQEYIIIVSLPISSCSYLVAFSLLLALFPPSKICPIQPGIELTLAMKPNSQINAFIH